MKPSLKVLPYRHHPKYKFVLDLRAFKKGRKFFKTRAEAEAEALRQRTLLERHSRALIGLSQREMSDIMAAREKLAEYGETIVDAPPEIFTAQELRSLLEEATRVAPDVVPMLTIGVFAGVRDAEIKRLDWHEIDLARGHIEIKAAKAKSARRRIVPIQPNLAAWLRPYNGMSGRVVPQGYRKKLERVRKASDLA